MITVGIDSGSQNTKAVLLRDGQLAGMVKQPTEFDVSDAARNTMEALLTRAGISRAQVAAVAATGVGRNQIAFADMPVNEVISASKGAWQIRPGCNIVIEMGAEASRAIRLNCDGGVKTYEVNDKCASGGGIFIETIARILQIETQEMGDYALRHTKEIPMNAQCVVFVESEVISLIHQNESRENIAHAVHTGICNRVCSMVRRLGVEENIVLLGGPGHNAGLAACMGSELGRDIFVPENPEFISALGAAIYAAETVAV